MLGIFVGGQSRRFGAPKGRAQVPGTDVSIVEKLVAQAHLLGIEPVTVGDPAAYRDLIPGVLNAADAPEVRGPIAGLLGLLRFAVRHGASAVLIVGCDQPFLSEALLQKLWETPVTSILASKQDGFVQPFPSKASVTVVPALEEAVANRAVRSFQDLFRVIESERFHLSTSELAQIDDWDEAPDDVVMR